MISFEKRQPPSDSSPPTPRVGSEGDDRVPDPTTETSTNARWALFVASLSLTLAAGALALVLDHRPGTQSRTVTVVGGEATGSSPNGNATSPSASGASSGPASVDEGEPDPLRARGSRLDHPASGDGFSFSVPGEDSGWSLSPTRQANAGRQQIRDLEGPAGELIKLVHTSGARAQPEPSTIVRAWDFDAPGVREAQRVVLENFPTDSCRDRLCDDYVLNDPGFGGLAILASDSGGPASKLAARVAASVVPDSPDGR